MDEWVRFVPHRASVGQERAPSAGQKLPRATGNVHLPGQWSRLDIESVTGDRPTLTLSRLRDEPSADLTLRNLMDALTLVYELRARYRVFEFEAAQEGAESCAELFAALSEVEGTQIRALMQGLRERLATAEHAAGEPA